MAHEDNNPLEIPDDALPKCPEELPGNLRRVAEIIAQVVGDDRAGALAAWHIGLDFRGTAIYCHNLDDWFRRHRNRMIVSEFDRRTGAGESATAVVRTMAMREWPGLGRISERTVWEVLGRPVVDDRQLGLWG